MDGLRSSPGAGGEGYHKAKEQNEKAEDSLYPVPDEFSQRSYEEIQDPDQSKKRLSDRIVKASEDKPMTHLFFRESVAFAEAFLDQVLLLTAGHSVPGRSPEEAKQRTKEMQAKLTQLKKRAFSNFVTDDTRATDRHYPVSWLRAVEGTNRTMLRNWSGKQEASRQKHVAAEVNKLCYEAFFNLCGEYGLTDNLTKNLGEIQKLYLKVNSGIAKRRMAEISQKTGEGGAERIDFFSKRSIRTARGDEQIAKFSLKQITDTFHNSLTRRSWDDHAINVHADSMSFPLQDRVSFNNTEFRTGSFDFPKAVANSEFAKRLSRENSFENMMLKEFITGEDGRADELSQLKGEIEKIENEGHYVAPRTLAGYRREIERVEKRKNPFWAKLEGETNKLRSEGNYSTKEICKGYERAYYAATNNTDRSQALIQFATKVALLKDPELQEAYKKKFRFLMNDYAILTKNKEEIDTTFERVDKIEADGVEHASHIDGIPDWLQKDRAVLPGQGKYAMFSLQTPGKVTYKGIISRMASGARKLLTSSFWSKIGAKAFQNTILKHIVTGTQMTNSELDPVSRELRAYKELTGEKYKGSLYFNTPTNSFGLKKIAGRVMYKWFALSKTDRAKQKVVIDETNSSINAVYSQVNNFISFLERRRSYSDEDTRYLNALRSLRDEIFDVENGVAKLKKPPGNAEKNAYEVNARMNILLKLMGYKTTFHCRSGNNRTAQMAAKSHQIASCLAVSATGSVPKARETAGTLAAKIDGETSRDHWSREVHMGALRSSTTLQMANKGTQGTKVTVFQVKDRSKALHEAVVKGGFPFANKFDIAKYLERSLTLLLERGSRTSDMRGMLEREFQQARTIINTGRSGNYNVKAAKDYALVGLARLHRSLRNRCTPLTSED